MSSSPEKTQSRMQAALTRLEREARGGLVPGEVETWCQGVRAALEDLTEPMKADRKRHEDLLGEILQTDRELSHRVENLREKGSRVHRELGRVRQEIDELRASDEGTTSDDPTERWKAGRERVLSWIDDYRSLDMDIQTWLIEAVQRDRGTAD